MLAACLDAAGSTLLPYIQHSLDQGLPELKGEFSLSERKVWKSKTGSIAANYITVQSSYDHMPAPVPRRDASLDHDHGHSHGRELATDSSHSHTESNHEHSHVHSDSHDHVHHHEHPSRKGPLRNLPRIRKLLEDAPTNHIPRWVKSTAIAAFTELAKAEALTHGAASPDCVNFHEVGAIDSIVDTVGTCLALDCLGVTTVSCSRLPLGEGTVWTDHGLLPVPAPATLRLMVDMPTCPGPPEVTGELVTPTAAALLKVLTKTTAQSQIPGRSPCFTIRKVGIGAGTKDFSKHPNILRLMIGDNVVR